jgi:peptidoglycan/xylan/chitin deacetylase (PgdA/CDA1 family)
VTAGALVISLDFELHWGVRDKHAPQSEYSPNLRGARAVIPRLLELFDEFGVSATWATVGFLFAETREDLARFSPPERPMYRDRRLSPYAEPVGTDEADDPLHFAPSLIRLIQRSPGQEIATHTFSHYYCGEAGQTRETFRADLAAACAIAARYGITFRSIVFPRNQHNPAYDDVLSEHGIRSYRGNPGSRRWRFTSAAESASPWKRAHRLLDAYVGGPSNAISWSEVSRPSGLSDVRATCLLRPYQPALRHLEPIRLDRLRGSLRSAAREGRILHLWWHPHNFGVHQEENLGFLRRILTEFAACRERFGMRSLSMASVDENVRSWGGAAQDAAAHDRGRAARGSDPVVAGIDASGD